MARSLGTQVEMPVMPVGERGLGLALTGMAERAAQVGNGQLREPVEAEGEEGQVVLQRSQHWCGRGGGRRAHGRAEVDLTPTLAGLRDGDVLEITAEEEEEDADADAGGQMLVCFRFKADKHNLSVSSVGAAELPPC